MTNEDLKISNLKENPFRLTPGDRVTIWAGHEDLRKLLHNVILSVRSDKVGITECVALYGELGTGKSHSLRFFQTLIDQEREDFHSKCVYLETLRVANKVTFLDIYRTIIERIGKSEIEAFAKGLVARIKTEIGNCKNETAPDAYKNAQERGENLNDTWLTEAISRVMGKYAPAYRIFELLSAGDEKAWFYLSAASQAKWNNADLSQLKITGPIESDFDAIENLGMLVNLTCGVKLNGTAYWKAFYLFLDEFEVLADLESKAMVAINQSLRDLLNACPEHLCLLLGLTGDAALVEGLFHTYLLSRMTREPIPIPSLDQTQSSLFLKEVLKQNRLDPKGPNEWHPFTKESIEFIVASTTDKTPRRLFINSRRVLELAAGEGTLRSGKKITKEDAERLLV